MPPGAATGGRLRIRRLERASPRRRAQGAATRRCQQLSRTRSRRSRRRLLSMWTRCCPACRARAAPQSRARARRAALQSEKKEQSRRSGDTVATYGSRRAALPARPPRGEEGARGGSSRGGSSPSRSLECHFRRRCSDRGSPSASAFGRRARSAGSRRLRILGSRRGTPHQRAPPSPGLGRSAC